MVVLTVEELLASLLKRRTFGLQVFFFDVTLAHLGREDLKTAPRTTAHTDDKKEVCSNGSTIFDGP